MNFFITGLPRSRTAWLANYFTSGDSFCWHEGMRGVYSYEEYTDRLAIPEYLSVGNADSMLFMGGYISGCPLVVIERDIQSVSDSLGFGDLTPKLEEHRDAMMKLGGLVIPFDDINCRLEEIHSHCIGSPYEPVRAAQLIDMNVQLGHIITDKDSLDMWESNYYGTKHKQKGAA